MSEIKRLKRDTLPSFTKKSNEEQYKANKSVLEAVVDASGALERNIDGKLNNPWIEVCLYSKKEADKSPYGWKIVVEYKHHDLAEDEEDEKKIYRAEARAGKASKRSATRSFGSQRGGSGLPTSRNSQLAVAQLPSPFTRINSQPSVNKFSGLCFSSGKPGHWRAACSNTPFAAAFQSDESGEIPKIMV